MPQWFVLILLTVSMFVGRVCPMLQKGHDNSTVDATANATTNATANTRANAIANITSNTTNTTSVSSNNDNKRTEPSAKAAEDTKDTLKSTNSSSPSTNATNTNVTNTTATNANVTVPPVNEKHNCNYTKESQDMLNCYATPHDSNEDTEEEASTSTKEPTTTTVTANNETKLNNTESQVPTNPSPKTKKKDKDKGEDVKVVLLNSTEAHDTSYEVETTQSSHAINTSDAVTDPKLGTNRTEVLISTVAPLVADNTPSAGSKDVVQELKSADESRKKGMPSGMIALVTAITFAVAIAVVYIGMIIWRRYIEYRYGHRELLVNELEFDTNDLRHFEL